MTDKDNKVDNKNVKDDNANDQPKGESGSENNMDKKLSSAQATKIAAQAKVASSSTSATAKDKSKAASLEKAKAERPKTTAAKTGSTTQSRPSKTAAIANSKEKQPTSKLAILALLIALIAAAGIVALYWWQQQQITGLEQQLHGQQRERLEQLESQLKTQLDQQLQMNQTDTVKGLATFADDIKQQSQVKITELEQSIQAIADQQPNNSHLTEAEYLVRMAGRVLWLEKDVPTTINLMLEADTRLSKAKDSRLLPIRQLIHQDIEQLKLLPVLETEEVILSFMGLAKQVKNLPLNTAQSTNLNNRVVDLQLSEDIGDWRENLAKTWQKIKVHFLTVRRRSGNVEPLMKPEFQQNLYHNLELKIQQVQWAVSQGRQALYLQSVDDIQSWLATYFDMTNESTITFNQRLIELRNKTINVDYPQNLMSQQALSSAMSNKQFAPAPIMPVEEPMTEQEVIKEDKETPDTEVEGNL